MRFSVTQSSPSNSLLDRLVFFSLVFILQPVKKRWFFESNGGDESGSFTFLKGKRFLGNLTSIGESKTSLYSIIRAIS